MAPRVGFEPTTNRLTADRSTTELPRSISNTWRVLWEVRQRRCHAPQLTQT